MRLDELKLLPEGKGVLLVEFGAWTSEDADAQAERFGAWLVDADPRPKYMVCTPHEAAAVWHVRESALGAVAIQPGKRPGLGRMGRLGGSARPPRLVPARDLRADARVQLRQPAVRPLRRRMRAHAHRLRPADASRAFSSSASSSIARPTSSSRTADRFRASTATDSRAARCCRRCSAPS